ncbi:MAG TPA: choice-of-anchor tandem repeat GloVer-containing protein [Terracidiphilus sp.]|nr:choice-of-anchor tandem repeat GloVer-containing protein [Terracidiphilus sp.]
MNNRKLYRSLIPVLLLSALPALARAQYNGIYTFNGNVEGDVPSQPAILAQGTDGYLHGTLPQGGTGNAGSWLQYNMSGLPLLTNFGGDGVHVNTNTGLSDAESGFMLGLDGNLYGAVSHVNGLDLGAVIRLVSTGGTPSIVYQFTGGTNGTFPKAPPIQGTDMNLYGVTSDYGNSGYVYQIVMNTTTGTGMLGWVHQLPSGSLAPLMVGSDGNFYGTYSNGSFSTNSSGVVVPSPNGYGGVFQITPAGNIKWYYNLNPFSSNNSSSGDGSNPQGGVMQAADGYLYGTASGGGTNATAGGVIFKIAINGTGYTVIHNFQSAEGTAPHGGLVQGSDGYLYGLTTKQGPPNPLGSQTQYKTSSGGTLFKVSTAGTNLTVLVPFFGISSPFNLGPGVDPESTPTLHTNGTIYGLTRVGGFSTTYGYNSAGVYTGQGAYDDAGEFFSYNAGLSPFISIIGRRSAKVGDQIGIIGQGFLNATGITFGGTAAPWVKFKVIIWSDNYMTVTVPAGAKTGPVVVQETTGNLSTLYNFTISTTCTILCIPLH